MIKNIRMSGSGKLADIFTGFFHVSHVFPEDSKETVTLIAKNAADEWGTWAEVVDNNAVTLSSKIADNDGYLTYLIVENTSAANKVYLVELAYGADKTVFGNARFYGGAVPKQSQRMFAVSVPAGETIYYRMKCETASATAEVHFRYHLNG